MAVSIAVVDGSGTIFESLRDVLPDAALWRVDEAAEEGEVSGADLIIVAAYPSPSWPEVGRFASASRTLVMSESPNLADERQAQLCGAVGYLPAGLWHAALRRGIDYALAGGRVNVAAALGLTPSREAAGLRGS